MVLLFMSHSVSLALDLEALLFVSFFAKARHTEPLLATASCLGITTKDGREDVALFTGFSSKQPPLMLL